MEIQELEELTETEMVEIDGGKGRMNFSSALTASFPQGWFLSLKYKHIFLTLKT